MNRHSEKWAAPHRHRDDYEPQHPDQHSRTKCAIQEPESPTPAPTRREPGIHGQRCAHRAAHETRAQLVAKCEVRADGSAAGAPLRRRIARVPRAPPRRRKSWAPRAATSVRHDCATRAQRTDTATTNATTTTAGRSPVGSEPTAPVDEHQGPTSASEEGRRSEGGREGRAERPLPMKLGSPAGRLFISACVCHSLSGAGLSPTPSRLAAGRDA